MAWWSAWDSGTLAGRVTSSSLSVKNGAGCSSKGDFHNRVSGWMASGMPVRTSLLEKRSLESAGVAAAVAVAMSMKANQRLGMKGFMVRRVAVWWPARWR